MSTKQFKIWLITNGYTQQTLAKRLCMTPQTISNYNNNNHYPEVFVMALRGLEHD